MGDIVLGGQNVDPSVILLRAFHEHRGRGNDIDESYRYARDAHPLEFDIIRERALRHGHELGVPGDMYQWRYEIILKGHHRNSQNGVSIGYTGCATCVVVKYRSHNFSGEVPGRIRVGGSGGRIKEAYRQRQRLLQDQEMTVYNQALHRSIISGLPLRLYAYMPNEIGMQYIYMGLVVVNSSIILWTPENFQCYEYRMVRFPENAVREVAGGPEGFILEGPEQVPEGPDEVLALEWHDVEEANGDMNNPVNSSMQEKVTEQPSMLQGGEISAYQLKGLQWMLHLFNNNMNGILADEMGFDKTIQTISLIAYLMENKNVAGPHLIVAPKSVLSNWMTGFNTWVPSIIAVHYDGRMEERKVLRDAFSGKRKLNVLITHYDMITRDKTYLKKIHWHYMIVDEGHRLNTYESAFARTVESGYKIRRRILLTGTPIPNSLKELWPLLNFVLPNIFNSVENFEEWFNAPSADQCDVSLVICRLHHVLRPFILSRKKKEDVEEYLHQQVTDVWRVGLGTAQDKREMLEDIMCKGSSSLGRDVPSERKINRLAARSIEEFWMFERMDEERRQKENSRSRLMEENEAVKYGEPVSIGKRKMKENLPPRHQAAYNNVGGVKKVVELKSEPVHVLIERSLESTSVMHPRRFGSRSEVSNSQDNKVPSSDDYSSQKQMLTWKIHKRKRSRCIYMPPHPVLCSTNIAL